MSDGVKVASAIVIVAIGEILFLTVRLFKGMSIAKWIAPALLLSFAFNTAALIYNAGKIKAAKERSA